MSVCGVWCAWLRSREVNREEIYAGSSRQTPGLASEERGGIAEKAVSYHSNDRGLGFCGRFGPAYWRAGAT